MNTVQPQLSIPNVKFTTVVYTALYTKSVSHYSITILNIFNILLYSNFVLSGTNSVLDRKLLFTDALLI